MDNRNAAYDLSLFDERREKGKVIKLDVKKIKRVRALKAKRAMIVFGSVVCTVVTAGVGLFISGQARIAELTAETTELSRRIEDNESLYTQLDMKRKAEVSKDSLASKLESELGMTKSGNIEYINVLNCNKIASKESATGFARLKECVIGFCNNLFSV